jgi:hypothetical protein
MRCSTRARSVERCFVEWPTSARISRVGDSDAHTASPQPGADRRVAGGVVGNNALANVHGILRVIATKRDDRRQENPMHINFQTYRSIKRTLAYVLYTRRNSHLEQHLNTLALVICGIVDAQHVQFDKIAAHVPIRGRKTESLITRFRRFVKHDVITLAG